MIQLRVRTEYTFGQTFAPIDRVIARLVELKVTAAGIVDHSSTWGHAKWSKACLKAGIKPLFGVELIVSDNDDDQTTMWFLAKNNSGLREMYRAASAAHRDPITTKRGPLARLRRERVEEMSDDILKFAGDILDGDWLASVGAAIDLNPSSRIVRMSKARIAEQHSLPMVETSDNFFAAPGDRELFEYAVDGGARPSPQYLLELAPDHFSEAVASMCTAELPKAPMVRAEGDVEALCREGIAARPGVADLFANDPRYEERLQHELRLIRSKEFDSYFIIVADMTTFAKRHMLVGPSRGSAAGSLVCYLMRITEVDPIVNELFFERFIDVSRSDLPDIDLDFPDSKRHMVFEYMAEKYGNAKVAHIGTVSTFKPKSALIQVCKKLNIPPNATGAVKVAMIERSGADSRANNCLLDTLETTEPGKLLVRTYPKVMLAAELEGHASHTGVHAAGLLVANVDIEDYCTVTAEGIAQVEKGAAEDLGLLKIDVLGLRTLGVLEDAAVPIDWYNLKFDDPLTFDVFNRRSLSCVFQFEGNAMRSVAESLTFTCLSDIDAVTALARPGPFAGGVTQKYLERRAGAKYEALHPLVAEQMRETFGLPLYQEQTMAIVREVGKFGWEDTSAIRKAISKRMGKEHFDKLWDRFWKGASENGVSEKEARATWELINVMGAWQMNKAHTRSYAIISYWAAYLKAHHPLEFAVANLRNAKDDENALTLLREMVREGISFQPFDPMISDETWAIKDGKLVAGYMTLHGFGEAKAKKYVEARRAGTLTQKMIDDANKADSMFRDIFPMETQFGDWYANPEAHGVVSRIYRLAEIDGTQEGSIVFIGRLIKKSLRDYNEQVLINKRGGKVGKAPLTFLDLHMVDDTGNIIGRIDRFKYKAIGEVHFNTTPVGAFMLVRAHFIKGIRFGFIEKVKVIE